MPLNDEIKSCLRLAMTNSQADFGEIVEEGLKLYSDSIGGPIQVEDEEEAEELIQSCLYFVLDETVSGMILEGIVEVKGVDDNGDLMYGLVGVDSKEDADRLREELDRWEDNGGPVQS